MTFEAAVDQWLAEHVRVKLKPFTVRDYERIAKALKKRFADKALVEITLADARAMHAEMATKPRRANYFLQTLGTVFSFHGETSPVKGIQKYRENVKERILSQDEMKAAFAAIAAVEADEKI